MSSNPNSNRIEQTPVRLSENVDVPRQTPNTEFGTRLKTGIDTAATAVANGAAVAAPFVPGGAIVSAAVSSVGTVTNSRSSGQAVSSQYAATGVVNLGGPAAGGGGTINTTVGAGGFSGSVSGTGSVGVGGGSGVANIQAGTPTDFAGQLQQSQADNSAMIELQISMEHESEVFSSISNVLKTRADAVKNSIQNIH